VLGVCRDYGERRLSAEMRIAVRQVARELLVTTRS
jgi:hypothetical protein